MKRSLRSSASRPRILLTGCYGGLGSALAARLVDAGFRVDGIDRAGARKRRLPATMRVFHRDIAAAGDLAKLVSRYDGIVHLAGCSRVGDARREPFAAIRANILGTAAILEAARRAKHRPWILFASSLEVKTPVRDAYGFTNLYGMTKAVAELLGRRYASDYGLVVGAARISGIYGSPDDYPDKVPLVFALGALAGRPLKVASNGSLMDYIHVDDACRALIGGMRQLQKIKAPAFAILQVRSGEKISLDRLARLVRDKARARVPIASFRVPAPTDVAIAELAATPAAIGLAEGLDRLIASLRKARDKR